MRERTPVVDQVPAPPSCVDNPLKVFESKVANSAKGLLHKWLNTA